MLEKLVRDVAQGTDEAVTGPPPPAARRVTITVHGRPAPQGSKRAFRNPATGRIQQVESSPHAATWRDDIINACRRTIDRQPPGWRPLDGPLTGRIVFSLPRPQSAPKRRRHPDGRPDLSKLLRATEDALTAAGLIHDDARIVEYTRLAKVFAGSTDPDALTTPGAAIRIQETQ